jgi:hypothetical protein
MRRLKETTVFKLTVYKMEKLLITIRKAPRFLDVNNTHPITVAADAVRKTALLR